jgi:hypothetical protein
MAKSKGENVVYGCAYCGAMQGNAHHADCSRKGTMTAPKREGEGRK